MNYSLPYDIHPQSAHRVSGNVEDFASVTKRHALAIVLGVVITGFIFGGSKSGRQLLKFIYYTTNHLCGGAPYTVSLPGPNGFPLVGVLYQLRGGHIQVIAEWIKRYGPVMRVALGEREAIIINSYSAMAQTVVAQGPAFQSRPTFQLFHSNNMWTIGSSPYSDRLVRTRKTLSTQMAPRILPTYIPIIQPKLRHLMKVVSNVSKGPAQDLADSLHCWATSLVTEQHFGISLPPSLISHIAHTEANISRQRAIGFPVRSYVPLMRAWGQIVNSFVSTFGTQYCRDENTEAAGEYRRVQQIYTDHLLSGLRERINNGDETPSILGNIMRSGSLDDEEILLISYTGTASGVNVGYSLTWIIGYIANHPEIQEKAYQAIHEVYHGAVPDPYDFNRIEYIKALHTEGSRYYVPVRVGFPRETLTESTYNGITIPAGVLTLMNCYACNMDPNVYDKPHIFIPERWMNGHRGRTDTATVEVEKIGVPHLTFGAGRRVCSGFEMANRGIYSVLVLLFHFFTWERASLADEERKLVHPPLRAARECTADMHPLEDTATPTGVRAIPWACGLKFTVRDPESLEDWFTQGDR